MLVLWEVRGRNSDTYRPSQVLSPRKLANLKKLALWLSQRARCSVHTQLFEIVVIAGKPQSKLYDVYWD